MLLMSAAALWASSRVCVLVGAGGSERSFLRLEHRNSLALQAAQFGYRNAHLAFCPGHGLDELLADERVERRLDVDAQDPAHLAARERGAVLGTAACLLELAEPLQLVANVLEELAHWRAHRGSTSTCSTEALALLELALRDEQAALAQVAQARQALQRSLQRQVGARRALQAAGVPTKVAALHVAKLLGEPLGL